MQTTPYSNLTILIGHPFGRHAEPESRPKRGFRSRSKVWCALIAHTTLTLSAQEAVPESDALISETDKVNLVEDSNVGEALKRRPDLRFENVVVDGGKTNVSLSSIPAEAVEKIEVMKAVTSDLDADSRGGSLNVRSQPSFELEERLVKGELEGNYNSLFEELRWKASLTYGQRIGSRERLGFRATGNYETRISGSDSIEIDWTSPSVEAGMHRLIEDQTLQQFRRENEDWKVNATLDLKFGKHHAV